MASNRQQEYHDHNRYKNLSASNSEPVQPKRSDVKQVSFDEPFQRKETRFSSILPSKIDFRANRGSSAPIIHKQVGSNKLFTPTKKQSSIFDNLKKK